jgi:hypothetical protein
MSPVSRIPKQFWNGCALALFCFWLPDVIIHIVGGYGFDRSYVWVITIVLPATTLVGLLLSVRLNVFRTDTLWLILGIWVTGPIAMMLSGATGGGALSENPVMALGGAILMTLIFPIATFIMSTYDGSLGAIAVVTLLLGLTHGLLDVRKRRARPV